MPFELMEISSEELTSHILERIERYNPALNALVRFLENGLWEECNDMLDDVKKTLISDEPEALVRRAIGIEKEKGTWQNDAY